MTFLEAAVAILKQERRPLHYREIARLAVAKDLLSHIGKTPEQAMQTRLSAALRRKPADSEIVRSGPGIYALRHLPPVADEEKVASKTEKETAPPKKETTGKGEDQKSGAPETADAGQGKAESPAPKGNSARPTPAARGQKQAKEQPRQERDSDGAPPSAGRRERRTRGRGRDGSGSQQRQRERGRAGRSDEQQQRESTSRSRKRRKRRRKSSSNSGNGDLPTTAARFLESRGKAATVTEIADSARSRGLLSGRKQQAERELITALKAENALRVAAGGRPRFVLSRDQKVDLDERLTEAEAARVERRIMGDVGRLRQLAAEKVASSLVELPLSSLVAIVKACLADSGEQDCSLRKSHAEAEAEITTFGSHAGQGPLAALIVRTKDGETDEVVRRRAAELRGSLHQFDATRGLLVVTGAASPAVKKENAVPGAPDVQLWDGGELARRMARLGLGFRTLNVTLPFFDAPFFGELSS